MAWRIEVQCQEWGNTLQDGWRPAIDGSLNQTGMTADEASTFTTRREAERVLDACVLPEGPDAVRIIAVDP